MSGLSVAVAVAAEALALAGRAAPLAVAAASGEPPYEALLFLASMAALAGVFLTLHGAPAYALLVWEGTAGAAAWVFVHPAVGAFFLLAAAFQVPMAAHLWGDPLSVRRRVGWLLRALVG